MAATIKIKIDDRAVRQYLTGRLAKQIPYARAAALNGIAFAVMRAENQAIGKIFAHPRPFTQRATSVLIKATRQRPMALVGLRPVQERYLAPFEYGGLHSIPREFLYEPVGAAVDAYMQLRKGTVARLAARKDVFIGTVHMISGFWQRLPKGQLKLLIRLLPNEPVHKHLDFEKRARAIAMDVGPAELGKAITRAISTAKF